MTPSDAIAAGLPPANRQFLDLASAPVIKRAVSPADRALTAAAAQEYQKGTLQVQAPASFEGAPAPLPLAPPNQPTLQTLTDFNNPVPVAPNTIPTGPVLHPTDPPRFQDRINQLYGQKRSAEERAEGLERQLAELTSRLDSRFAATPPNPTPFTNQYGSYAPPTQAQPQFGTDQQSASSAGQYVSRDEMRALLVEQAQAITRVNTLSQAHIVSRLEAERFYPDVFNNPELKSAADEIWARDPSFRNDPRGPEKVALMVRGMAIGHIPFSQGPQVPAQVRKENLSGVGATVPEGSAPPDQANRFYTALAEATRSQRLEDFAKARRIQQGLE